MDRFREIEGKYIEALQTRFKTHFKFCNCVLKIVYNNFLLQYAELYPLLGSLDCFIAAWLSATPFTVHVSRNADWMALDCPCGNLRKKSSKTCARKCGRKQQKCGEKCGTCQELTELLAENCGFGPNHEICCILRIAICVLWK